LFLHKLVRINISVLEVCYDMFSHSVEFTLLCYSFDIALDLCPEVETRSKVFSVFNHIVHKPLSVTHVDSVFLLHFMFVLYFICLNCLSTAYGE